MAAIDVIEPARTLVIRELLFGLSDRVVALSDLIGDCPGPSAWTTATGQDLFDTIAEIVRHGEALRALGFGR
jgi:hypothetical protein